MSHNSRVCNCMSHWMSNNSRVCNSMSLWMSNNRVCNSMCNGVGNGVRISSSTIISNISYVSIIIISMVVDMLNAAIRKVDRVGTLYNTSTIIGLSLVECSTRIIIRNSIIVRVGRRFSKVRLGISTNSMSNNWSMMNNRSMDNRSMVDNGSMVDNRMGNSNWMSYSMTN